MTNAIYISQNPAEAGTEQPALVDSVFDIKNPFIRNPMPALTQAAMLGAAFSFGLTYATDAWYAPAAAFTLVVGGIASEQLNKYQRAREEILRYARNKLQGEVQVRNFYRKKLLACTIVMASFGVGMAGGYYGAKQILSSPERPQATATVQMPQAKK